VKRQNAETQLMAEGRLKIVVFGSFNAGKSTFIQALDPRARHIEANTEGGMTTVAFDYGRVQLHGQQVYLFGSPGQERYEFVRRILARGMNGAIIVVDATEGIDDMTRTLYAWLKELQVPIAIMLNKCDNASATPDVTRECPKGVIVHAISARTGENVQTAMGDFIASILTARCAAADIRHSDAWSAEE
jgi:uncharacterized protein